MWRLLNAAFHGHGALRHLSTDHDPLFEGHRWKANLRFLEIDEVKTVRMRRSVNGERPPDDDFSLLVVTFP